MMIVIKCKNFFIVFPFFGFNYKSKSAATEVTAPKNANSNCRQTNRKDMGI
jgi:hypothetical protein